MELQLFSQKLIKVTDCLVKSDNDSRWGTINVN